jgi:hypothetical protein
MTEFENNLDLSETITAMCRDALNALNLKEGVASVKDWQGNPPNEINNYLLNEEGTEFAGVATLWSGENFHFSLIETANGIWKADVPCAMFA